MSSTRQYEIEVISPGHIGSGVTISPIEYVVDEELEEIKEERKREAGLVIYR